MSLPEMWVRANLRGPVEESAKILSEVTVQYSRTRFRKESCGGLKQKSELGQYQASSPFGVGLSQTFAKVVSKVAGAGDNKNFAAKVAGF